MSLDNSEQHAWDLGYYAKITGQPESNPYAQGMLKNYWQSGYTNASSDLSCNCSSHIYMRDFWLKGVKIRLGIKS